MNDAARANVTRMYVCAVCTQKLISCATALSHSVTRANTLWFCSSCMHAPRAEAPHLLDGENICG
jgi:hypothetical protein